MVSFKALTALLLAGTALAAPAPHHRGRRPGRRIIWKTLVKTEYVTVWPGTPKETAKPTTTVEVPEVEPTSVAPKSSVKPVESSYVVVTPTPTPNPSPKPEEPEPEPTKPAESAPEEPKPAPTKPAEGTYDNARTEEYMAIVDEWRARLGKGKLNWDAKLEANAIDTSVSGNGKMVHKLNPGTFGQVMAPGTAENFYHCFVGGWLCERPDMAGMNNVCDTITGWGYTTTGHADILSSDGYTKIGCGWANRIWTCDVA